MLRRLLPVVVALGLAAAPAEAIVGGSVTQRQWPAMAQLNVDNNFTCGANLVRPEWVLTAAHCIEGLEGQPGRLSIVLGRTTLNGSGGSIHAVDQVVRHESYDGSGYDVALLRLATATTLAPIRIVELSEADLWTPGTSATIIGWGAQNWGGGPSNELRETQVPIVPDNDCQASYGLTLGFDATTMVCAGEPSGQHDSCSGDSGGPLMVADRSGAPVLAGAVSFGLGCAFPTQYGVYSRVGGQTLRKWLDSKLPATGAPLPPTATAPAPETPGTGPVTTTAPVTVRFTTALGSAARVKRTRRLALRLRSSAPVRNVSVKLMLAGRTLARGRLEKLGTGATLTLKLSRTAARRVRRGAVAVRVTAVDAQGRTARAQGTGRLGR